MSKIIEFEYEKSCQTCGVERKSLIKTGNWLICAVCDSEFVLNKKNGDLMNRYRKK